MAATPAMAFSKAVRVHTSRARMLRRTASMMTCPQRRHTSSLRLSTCGTAAVPMGARPISSITVAMVLAVNWPPHAPAPGHAWSSISSSSSSEMRPAAFAPTASNTSPILMSRPLCLPGRIDPP